MSHADHLSAAPYLQEMLGGKLAIGAQIAFRAGGVRQAVQRGRDFAPTAASSITCSPTASASASATSNAVALHPPGHTPAGLAYVIGDAVFIGDTLFMPDYGTARADFPGGDARQLYRSIRRCCRCRPRRGCSCATTTRGRIATTTAGRRPSPSSGQHVHVHDGVDEAAFVAMREARDSALPLPRLILPSVQVNIRGGHLPAPEDNGIRYLKLPLNAI